MAYVVYLLECEDGSIYTGITTDMKRRFAEHKEGKGAKFTRSRKPKRVLWTEAHSSRSAAQKREAQIKKLKRRAKMALAGILDAASGREYHSNMRLNVFGKPGLAELADKLSLASDPTRLRIINVILEGEKICVSEVAKELKLSVAVVSHHMNALADAGMLAPERYGKRICYVPAKDPFFYDLKKLIQKYS